MISLFCSSKVTEQSESSCWLYTVSNCQKPENKCHGELTVVVVEWRVTPVFSLQPYNPHLCRTVITSINSAAKEEGQELSGATRTIATITTTVALVVPTDAAALVMLVIWVEERRSEWIVSSCDCSEQWNHHSQWTLNTTRLVYCNIMMSDTEYVFVSLAL